MAVPSPSKSVLRADLKQRRHHFVLQLDLSQRAAAHEALCDRVLAHGGDMRTVSAYLAIGDEIDPLLLLENLSARGVTTVLPHVTGRHEPLRFLCWRPGDPLDSGPMGLRQPAASAPEAEPDVILTPLLGYDRALNRIGYGAGHYDRAFARHPAARRIGLAWSVQECADIPVDRWDVPLHAVATEKDWIA